MRPLPLKLAGAIVLFVINPLGFGWPFATGFVRK